MLVLAYRYSLSPGVLSVSHGVSYHILQEYLEDSSGLFIDQAGDTFDSTSSSQSSDSGLGDTLYF